MVDGDIIRILYGKYNLHFGRLMVTPSAKRNSCRVAKRVGVIPRVEALRTSTLGWGNATPTELPLLAGCLRCAVAIRRKKPAIFAWVAMMAGLKDIGVGLLHGNEPEGYAVVAILEAILGLGFSRA